MKVGVIGTGQLSLLMAQANQDLGIELIPFGEKTCELLSSYCQPVYEQPDNFEALKQFADSVDVITYESENVSVAMLESLNCAEKIRPSIESLKIFQHRLNEKNYLIKSCLQTVKYMPVSEEENLAAAAKYIGFPAIIKTLENGYDGRGQKKVNNYDELKSSWLTLNKNCIVEEFYDFDHEISIVAVRDSNKNIIFYPVSENFHRDGQLRLSLVMGGHRMQGFAENAIRTVMNDLDYIGCMSMEFFVKDDRLIVNEVAPRVHNSGHWTIDGANSSQFLKHLKAITNKCVFKPSLSQPAAMVNLIGDLPEWSKFPNSTYLKVYDYGKEPRKDRKVGHINILGDNLSEREFYAIVANLLEELSESALADHIFNRILSMS